MTIWNCFFLIILSSAVTWAQGNPSKNVSKPNLKQEESNVDATVFGLIPANWPRLRGPWKNPGFSHLSCTNKSLNKTTTPFAGNGVFDPKCAPEVLYSWQTPEMLEFYTSKSTPQNLIPLQRLFAWRTPLYLFGFGSGLMRMKLRSDAQFVNLPQDHRTYALEKFGWIGERARLQTCQFWIKTLNAPSRTVFVATYDYVSEYILCDSSAVESFSVASPELLFELQWELDQILQARQSDSDYDTNQFDRPVLYTRVPWEMIADNKDWSINHLKQNFRWIKNAILNSKGEGQFKGIYYAEGVPKSRERHFEVSRPTYYQRRTAVNSDHTIATVSFFKAEEGQPWQSLENAEGYVTKCVGQKSCVWSLPKVSKKKNSTEAYGMTWTCGQDKKKYSVAVTSEEFNDENLEFLNDQLVAQCEDPKSTAEISGQHFPTDPLEVVSAQYGPASQMLDVSKYAQKFCDGKTSCRYEISHRFLGQPKPLDNAAFQIQYKCGKGPVQSLSIDEKVEKQLWILSCVRKPQRLR